MIGRIDREYDPRVFEDKALIVRTISYERIKSRETGTGTYEPRRSGSSLGEAAAPVWDPRLAPAIFA